MSLPPTLPPSSPSSSIQLTDELDFIPDIVPSSTNTTQTSLQGLMTRSDLTQANVTQATTRSIPLIPASSVTPTTSLQHRECSFPADDSFQAKFDDLLTEEHDIMQEAEAEARARAKRSIYATGSDDSQSQGSSAKQARMASQAPWTIDSDHTQTRAESPNQDKWQSLPSCEYASTSHFPAVTQSQQQMQFNQPITTARPVLSGFYTNQYTYSSLPQATASSPSTYTPYATFPTPIHQQQPIAPSQQMMSPQTFTYNPMQAQHRQNIPIQQASPTFPTSQMMPPHQMTTPWKTINPLSMANYQMHKTTLGESPIQSSPSSNLNILPLTQTQQSNSGNSTVETSILPESLPQKNEFGTFNWNKTNCLKIAKLLQIPGMNLNKIANMIGTTKSNLHRLKNEKKFTEAHWTGIEDEELPKKMEYYMAIRFLQKSHTTNRDIGSLMGCSHANISRINIVHPNLLQPSRWELDDTQANEIGRRHAEALGYKPSTSS